MKGLLEAEAYQERNSFIGSLDRLPEGRSEMYLAKFQSVRLKIEGSEFIVSFARNR